jgi:serine/threonine protein kinase
LLVPVRTTEDTLVGVIALGDRRNEEPYTREDLRLLRAIADTGALVIEHQAMRTSEPALAAVKGRQVGFDARSDRAAECSSCGSVYQGGSRSCTSCDRPLEAAAVPYVLLGKFRFERRVGRGGMGIVYRAIDLALDRAVAIKTLPGASPERAQRLRHEAKAMAAVTHQHLASIYGLEAWRGQPLLVCEYMTGGTLADRLEKGSLPIQEALTLGVQLAEALDVVHRADLLHRDIKPSNIGYLDRATPKLLDFGLVHMLLEARVEHAVMGDQAPDSGQQPFLSSLSVSRGFVGTPLYLSPEAARGEAPSTAFDLWSLNVLLLEAIIGRHPFRGRSLQDTLDRIGQADLQGVLTALQHRAPRVAGYFERALARSASNRPPSARDVAGEIRRLVS